MAGLTDAYESKVGDHFLRNSSQTPDATLYAGLFTTLPADAGTGGVEVSASGYGRFSCAFDAASLGVIGNSADITFTSAAPADWGTIRGLGLWNASSGGTLVAFGPLRTPLLVVAGSPCAFAAGKITVTAPSSLTVAYRNKTLNHFFRNSSQTPDAVIALALAQNAPDANGTGWTECPAPWYARKSLGLSAFSAGVAANAGDLLFGSNVPSDGGILTHGVVVTSLTIGAGNVILSYPMAAALVAAVGSTIDIPPGQFSVMID